MRLAILAAAIAPLAACSLISPDTTPDELRANADSRTTLKTHLTPGNACPKVARMLAWCARGPSYHYRCNTAANGARSELVGTLEAVFRTETLLVVDFVRKGSETEIKVQQRDGVLLYEYAPLISRHLAGTSDCSPP